MTGIRIHSAFLVAWKTLVNVLHYYLFFYWESTQEEFSDERSCKFVSSRGIAKSCDVFPISIISDSVSSFDESVYIGIKDGQSVYVVTDQLKQFYEQVFKKLEIQGKRIVLVTGASVRSVPDEISSLNSIDYSKVILDSPATIKWFTQNYSWVNSHPKISPIPLGINYHTLSQKPHWWGKYSTPLDQESEMIKLIKSSPPYEERRNRCFSFFHFNISERHDGDRRLALKALMDVDFNDFANRICDRKTTWDICTKYKYIVSPHGHGLDCHRTYEAIALGCLPVVRSSSLDVIYERLPVIILDKWEDISIELLENRAVDARKNRTKLMQLGYWKDLIKSAI
ncbi:MAG: hypothetical protein JXR10_15205 [Cyclobacteriaceae bacterium]